MNTITGIPFLLDLNIWLLQLNVSRSSSGFAVCNMRLRQGEACAIVPVYFQAYTYFCL